MIEAGPCLFLHPQVDVAAHSALVGRIEQGGFFGDLARFVGSEQALIKGMPAKSRTCFAGFVKRFAL